MATPSYIPQSPQRQISQENYTTATASITAIRPTMRNELLTPKAHRSCTTITPSDRNLGMVNHSSPP